jgi:hypothetical protein
MNKNQPDTHLNGVLKQLSTPWIIASERAYRVNKLDLKKGFILDLACGSGIQLAAYSSQLNAPCIGIEIDLKRAEIATNTLKSILKKDLFEKSRIIVGDCLQKSEIILDENIRFSLIHLDPARPTDVQSHTISEMMPPPIEAIETWKDLLIENEGGIILDLSPRLSKAQCDELKNNLERILPNFEQTWEWSSQGRGRVDRLSVWLGAAATKNMKSRYVRNYPKEIEHSTIIESENLPWEHEMIAPQKTDVKVDDFLSIIDPALIASGLENAWLELYNHSGQWIRKEGRRPLFVHPNKLVINDENRGLVFESGIIRAIIPHDINDGVEPLIELSKKLELMKLTLRLKISPELQPVFQSRIDRSLIDTGGVGFVVKLPNNTLAICVKI